MAEWVKEEERKSVVAVGLGLGWGCMGLKKKKRRGKGGVGGNLMKKEVKCFSFF